MKIATLYCGISSAMKELGMHDAERLIDTHLTGIATTFGGYTKQVCTGGWVDLDGKLVQDTTLRVEVVMKADCDVSLVRAVAKDLATDFGEECVLLTLVDCEYEFVKGEGL